MTASIDLLRRRALGALVLLLWTGVPLVLAAAAEERARLEAEAQDARR